MEDTHLRHLCRIIGGNKLASEITPATLQTFVDVRCREQVRGNPDKARTIKKAVATLRFVWKWCYRKGFVPIATRPAARVT